MITLDGFSDYKGYKKKGTMTIIKGIKMLYKAGFIFLTLLVGSYGFPLNDEQDMSIFFDRGVEDSMNRILGGFQAGPVPHMVALTNGEFRSLLCGGSLISNRHILTAAHCIRGVFIAGGLSRSLRGVVGSNRWNSGGVIYSISRNFTHPHYVQSIIKNDIGIFETTINVIMSHAVSVVPLSYEFVGGNVAVRVNGWGRTRAGGYISATLLELHSHTVNGIRCIEDVRRRAQEINMSGVPAVQPHIEICVFAGIDKGTCHGDSGSALIRQNNGQQIGVVSWGLPCGRGAPDMFVRVSAYRPWIEKIIGNQ